MWFTNLLKRRRDFQDEIIRSNSGVSSKSYVMINGFKLARFIVYWYVGVQTVEIFTDYSLNTNWMEFVAVLAALTAFVVGSAWGKIKGEQSYYGGLYGNDSNETPNINEDDKL